MSSPALHELESIPSRWLICSGRDDEHVDDRESGKNSPFAQSILDVLRTNKHEMLNVAKLADLVTELARSNSDQLPEGNPLIGVGHQGGQYVFHRKDQQEKFWEDCQLEDTGRAYCSYLRQFPDGKYANNALKRILDIEDQEAWTKAIKAEKISPLHTYLSRYPNGNFVKKAKSAILDMEAGGSQIVGKPLIEPAQTESVKDRKPDTEEEQILKAYEIHPVKPKRDLHSLRSENKNIFTGPDVVKPEVGQRWAIIIGISSYLHKNLNLQYANRDAEALHQLIQKPSGGGFSRDKITFLADEEATTGNITRAIRSFLQKPAKEDVVLIYLACHGAPDPKRPSVLYLLTHDTDPSDIPGTALPMREIDNSLKENLIAEKVVLIADTCHSAALGGNIGVRGLTDSSVQMNQYLRQLSESKPGFALLTSAEASEVSYEDEKWGGGHGVFTHYLLEGMNGEGEIRLENGIVTVGNLFEYVRDSVKKATDHKQHPAIGPNQFDRTFPMSFPGLEQATKLHNQATTSLKAGDLDEAQRLWKQVLKFVPRHKKAEQGLDAVEKAEREQLDKKNAQILILLEHLRANKLPLEEFDRGIMLVEKNQRNMTIQEVEIRNLLDALIEGKLSAYSYLGAIRALTN